MTLAPDLAARLDQYGQRQILRFWDRLDTAAQTRLTDEIASIDFEQLDRLVQSLVLKDEPALPHFETVRQVPISRLPRTDAERGARRLAAELGESMLSAGEVAVVIVAGGQGTRLGFNGPKGTYPIGPVSNATLFQIHAEKVLALSRKFGKPIPLYVMTSPDNHQATEQFFQEHQNFGLEHVRLFVQGQMPAVDRQTGKILLSEPGRIALSPDGHGGTLRALARPGTHGAPSCLDEMRERGVSTLFYFQVDNPMVRVAEPSYLGLHRQAGAEVSFKVVEKVRPDERVGVVVEADGRPQVIEYSDLPDELAERREPDGGLQLWAGSIAIHVFDRAFIERIVRESSLPFHRAVKRVAHQDDAGHADRTLPAQCRQVRDLHLRLAPAGRAVLDRRDRPPSRIRAPQERHRPRFARNRASAHDRPLRRLARIRRRRGHATPRRSGPLRPGNQPPVRSRPGGTQGEDLARVQGGWTAVSQVMEEARP